MTGQIGDLFGGVPIAVSPLIPSGEAFIVSGTLMLGADPETDVQYARRLARWIVRDGLRDVCDWLDIPVGARPVQGEPVLDVRRLVL